MMNVFMLPNLAKCIEDLYQPYVQKGAAWLDEYDPQWAQKINPEMLDLSSGDLCICGQMFGAYANRPEFVGDSEAFGFCARSDIGCHIFGLHFNFDGSERISYNALDRLWLDEVFWRTAPDVA